MLTRCIQPERLGDETHAGGTAIMMSYPRVVPAPEAKGNFHWFISWTAWKGIDVYTVGPCLLVAVELIWPVRWTVRRFGHHERHGA